MINEIQHFLIENNKNRVGKKIYTDGEKGNLINLSCYKSGKDEAINVGDKIEKLKNDFGFNNMAILVRAIFRPESLRRGF